MCWTPRTSRLYEIFALDRYEMRPHAIFGTTAAAMLVMPSTAADVMGVDVSQPVSPDAAKCMAGAGKTFGIVRAWESIGHFDKNAPASMAAFAGAGVNASIYMFPCSFGMSPKAQLAMLQGNLTAAGVSDFGMMYFDVEYNPDPVCAWKTTDTAANCAYMGSLVQAAQAMPFFAGRTGIYSTIHFWQNTLMGPNCTVGSELPLWYAHYEVSANHRDPGTLLCRTLRAHADPRCPYRRSRFASSACSRRPTRLSATLSPLAGGPPHT